MHKWNDVVRREAWKRVVDRCTTCRGAGVVEGPLRTWLLCADCGPEALDRELARPQLSPGDVIVKYGGAFTRPLYVEDSTDVTIDRRHFFPRRGVNYGPDWAKSGRALVERERDSRIANEEPRRAADLTCTCLFGPGSCPVHGARK